MDRSLSLGPLPLILLPREATALAQQRPDPLLSLLLISPLALFPARGKIVKERKQTSHAAYYGGSRVQNHYHGALRLPPNLVPLPVQGSPGCSGLRRLSRHMRDQQQGTPKHAGSWPRAGMELMVCVYVYVYGIAKSM